ncbi:MAG TPA: hypothetical protein VKG26_01945 [Bacteroidia bacterium]|nr:hypothetical protein [Bacteroidia bacterium]
MKNQKIKKEIYLLFACGLFFMACNHNSRDRKSEEYSNGNKTTDSSAAYSRTNYQPNGNDSVRPIDTTRRPSNNPQ